MAVPIITRHVKRMTSKQPTGKLEIRRSDHAAERDALSLYDISLPYYNQIRREILSTLGVRVKTKLKVTGECSACNLLGELLTSSKLVGQEKDKVKAYQQMHVKFWMGELAAASDMITRPKRG